MRTSWLLVVGVFAFSAVAGAETLSVHKNKTRIQYVDRPSRGQDAKQVIQQLGEPKFRHAPVGGGSPKQPPITRWDYEGFSVFFEKGHVIDTVVKGQPPEISHKDELKPAR